MKMIFIFFLFFQFTVFAQCDTTNIVEFPEVDASFPGGSAAMLRFIQQNLEYPEIDRCSMGIKNSRIYLEFIVCADGSIMQIRCIRGMSEEFNKMALDLVEKMPKWIPAEQNGKIVASRCRLPIIICLQ